VLLYARSPGTLLGSGKGVSGRLGRTDQSIKSKPRLKQAPPLVAYLPLSYSLT